MKIKKTKRLKKVKSLIPNVITIMTLCAGLTSIRMTLEGKWEFAVLSILLAAILDFMDGKVARLLKVSSVLGGELDSLSDLVNFGFAPSFLIYQFSLMAKKRLGWSAVIFFTICMALRLARFNTSQLFDQNFPKDYSVGVPAPAGAMLILIPVNFYLATDLAFLSAFWLNFISLWVCGGLLISKIPTYSLKSLSYKPNMVYMYIILFTLLSTFLYTHPWSTLAVIGLLYFISIGVSAFKIPQVSKELR